MKSFYEVIGKAIKVISDLHLAKHEALLKDLQELKDAGTLSVFANEEAINTADRLLKECSISKEEKEKYQEVIHKYLEEYFIYNENAINYDGKEREIEKAIESARILSTMLFTDKSKK
jgi:hypothetical protein